MTNQETLNKLEKVTALNKLETATTLMCEVLDVLKGHNFSALDGAIKVCYNIEDYLEKEIAKESHILKYKNNWESDEYYLNGVRVDNISAVEINGKRYGVTRRIVAKSYSDHGHRYEANSWHYFIKETVLGTAMEIDLNTIVNKIQVRVVE